MIKSVSTIQAKQVLDATNYLQVSDNAVKIFDIEGEVSSTTGTDYFIQLLTTDTPVSGTTIPLYSRQCVLAAANTGINGFSFVYRPQGIDTALMANPVGGTLTTAVTNTKPIYVAISSTDGVYTSVAASTQVTINFEEQLDEPVNQIVVNSGANQNALTVFSSPHPAYKLTKLKVTRTVGVAYTIFLFAYSPVSGDLEYEQVTVPITAGNDFYMDFGAGLKMMQTKNYSTNYTGCYVAIGDASGTFVPSASSTWTIEAYYQTI